MRNSFAHFRNQRAAPGWPAPAVVRKSQQSGYCADNMRGSDGSHAGAAVPAFRLHAGNVRAVGLSPEDNAPSVHVNLAGWSRPEHGYDFFMESQAQMHSQAVAGNYHSRAVDPVHVFVKVAGSLLPCDR